MLKIRDDVNLKELAKKYNMVYCEDYRTPFNQRKFNSKGVNKI